MKRIRQIHLYLGALFAPLLLFFALTGAWQTFGFHEAPRDKSYTPPAWIAKLSEVHKNQRLEHSPGGRPSVPLRWFILLTSIGLIVTTALGIYMAFRYTQNMLVVWLSLVAGIILPIILLYL